MKEFHLISAPFSCGISWAVSVLMELGVRTTHAEPKRYPRGFWSPVPDSPGLEEIVPEGMAHMRYYLPLLHERTRFRLDPSVEVFWEHRLDFIRNIGRPVILFVRDPRDAIRSLYLRNYTHFGWHEYLKRPDLWADHFPGMFGLPPAETWAAWHAAWMGVAPLTGIHVVRFEDSRQRPVEIVRDMLRFLGLERSDEEIRRAVDHSTFEKTRSAMERAERATGVAFRIARRGQVGEWRECFDEEALALFGGPAADWMGRLGYAPAPGSMRVPAPGPPLVEHEFSWDLRSALGKARQSWSSGSVEQGRTGLGEALRLARLGRARERAELFVAAEAISLEWTTLVLGADLGARHPAWTPLLESFVRFNRLFAFWPSINKVLTAHAASVRPVQSDAFGRLDVAASPLVPPPVLEPAETAAPASSSLLIEENYRGYDLFGCGGRCFAVARGRTTPDFARLSRQELVEEKALGRIFVADLSFEAKEAVDRHLREAGAAPRERGQP
jgi:hypothetical protein